MLEPVIKYLSEPTLTFAHGQKAMDPRDGLMLFGPFDANRYFGQMNIGIIGPNRLRRLMIDYLHVLDKPVFSDEDVNKHPTFLGLESVLGVFVNYENIPQIDISENSIKEALRHQDNHVRVHKLVSIYVDKITDYLNEEERPVNLWLVVIPEGIYTHGRPKSSALKMGGVIKSSVSRQVLKNRQQNLFEEFNNEEEAFRKAYEYEVNFHNQMKARLLGSGITTQIIRESKISFSGMDTKQQLQEEKIKTAKAWNLAVALYYKMGGLPWKMGDVRQGVCYLGIVYKKTQDKGKNACCAAQMFLDSGDGMVFRGNVGPWWNEETGEYHLDKADAKKIISRAMQSYFSQFNRYPTEVFIHAKTYFNDEEWDGFQEAAEGKSQIIGVRIRNNNVFKLYREHQYSVPRGLMLQYDDNKAFLWTKGYIPRFKTQIGLETPNPLDIQIDRGNGNVETVCKDILSLSKLNYNACIYGDGLPVTLKFAESIGEILTSAKHINGGVLPFKFYI